MAKKEKVRYKALMHLWHSEEQRYIEPGEEVNLSHLGPGLVDLLLALGGVSATGEEEGGMNDAQHEKL